MDAWEDFIDPNLPWVPRIGGIDILHTHAGVNRLEDIVEEAVELAKDIGSVLSGLESAKSED